MVKLLLAEDEEMLAQAICYTLNTAGLVVTHVKNGEEAISLLQTQSFDLAILDINMPKVDGLEVTRLIRQRQNTPILMLTALRGEANILTGFAAGADDYLTKPFSYKELLARVTALLRRSQASLPQPDLEPLLSQGRLQLDPNTYVARLNEIILPLTLTEFRILAYLIEHTGRACQAKEILQAVQGYQLEEYEAREILRVHINHIRQKMKIGPDEPEYIENVYGIGYIIKRT